VRCGDELVKEKKRPYTLLLSPLGVKGSEEKRNWGWGEEELVSTFTTGSNPSPPA
jgi:hypothetical protein